MPHAAPRKTEIESGGSCKAYQIRRHRRVLATALRPMPGTPIAQAPDASNSPNPTSSIQSPGNHEQLAYTNIHGRAISHNSEFGYFKVIPIRIFYRPLGNNCPFQAVVSEDSKSLLTPSLSEL
jgi:hypothetical protein